MKVNSEYEGFEQFIRNKELKIRELVSKYSLLENFSENPELYSDFK